MSFGPKPLPKLSSSNQTLGKSIIPPVVSKIELPSLEISSKPKEENPFDQLDIEDKISPEDAKTLASNLQKIGADPKDLINTYTNLQLSDINNLKNILNKDPNSIKELLTNATNILKSKLDIDLHPEELLKVLNKNIEYVDENALEKLKELNISALKSISPVPPVADYKKYLIEREVNPVRTFGGGICENTDPKVPCMIGVAVGVAVGVPLGLVTLGVGIGVGIGIAAAACFYAGANVPDECKGIERRGGRKSRRKNAKPRKLTKHLTNSKIKKTKKQSRRRK